MAPAGLLSPALTVQSIRSPTSCAEKWQPKRLVPSGSVLARSPSNNTPLGNTSVKSSIYLCPSNAVFQSRRRSRLRPNARGGSSRHAFTANVEGSVAVEETSAIGEESSAVSVAVQEEVAAPALVVYPQQSTGKFKPRVPGQKMRREDAIVPPEALTQGAVFKGKVTTIQPFGAFVDFGAFTDGLVHISKLSSGYVNNVSDIVTIGQEVTVTILNVEQISGRIALTMREEKEPTRQAEASVGSRFVQGSDGKPINRGRIAGGRQAKRDEPQKPQTKLVKGEAIEGTVRNKIRSGVFVELPGGEEGFLRYSDIPGGENMVSETSLQTGQQVKATVLRIDRGSKIVLTMKAAVDITSVNRDINKGQSVVAKNPFEIAFRSLNFIPEAVVEPAVTEPEEVAVQTALEAPDEAFKAEETPALNFFPDAVTEPAVTEPEEVAAPTVEAPAETPKAEDIPALNFTTQAVVEAAVTEPEEVAAQTSLEAPDETAKAKDTAALNSISEAVIEPAVTGREEIAGQTAVDAAAETPKALEIPALNFSREPVIEPAATKPEEVSAETAVKAPTEALKAEDVPALNFIREAVREPEEVGAQTAFKAPTEAPQAEDTSSPAGDQSSASPAVIVSAALVKELRSQTGSGMMDCKKALAATANDLEKAVEFLRKKGLASAEKKASRLASEGLIGTYIHDGRIGVLIEVNCETDFVARGDKFKELVEDMAMQVAAYPQVQVVSVDDVPAEVVAKEREIESGKEDLASKPEAIRSKIVEGRVTKRLAELALLEQAFIKDDKKVVRDVVKETVASLGENIQVRRFIRFNLGEGIEKKVVDFAAEVAAQTAPKAEETPEPAADKSTASSAGEESPASPAVVVSAALVKELRAQTGSGLMDCKKALAASANDMERAVEFLRKKGLASAEKKASRLASEGLIGTYIHDGRIGVLIEVNCETDFVARGDKFKELVEDMAMQVAAYPQVQVVSVDDVPAEVVAKEKEIESGKEDLASKPEAIRSKIVEGRVSKRLAELALLEQPFIKDDKKMVKEIVKETVASLGENIQVRRFTRFNLGEGIEKKVVNFAAEVAAQTAVQSVVA